MRRGAARLASAGIEGAARDARWLLAWAAGIPRDRLTPAGTATLPADASARFDDAVARRAAREPVSTITGTKTFWGRDFLVTRDVLAPRPETETLVAEALEGHFERVLDLGTGSGAILVTLLAERPRAAGVGTDVSPEALRIAGENAARHGVAPRAVLPLSDWWRDVGGSYDLIVSNPPYVAATEMDELAPELAHEPRAALTDGGDGLEAYRAILPAAPGHLRPGGRLLLEIGPTQGVAVVALAVAAGLAQVRLLPDLDGRDRVLAARKP